MPLAHWARGLADACGVSPSREEIHAKAERLRGRVFPFERKDSERLYSPPCPYGYPGDRLWVRETWTWIPWQKEGTIKVSYGADGAQREVLPYPNWNGRLCKLNEWRPSIFMPRWASRLTLEITDVRVQRVEEISEADALAEGIGRHLLDEGRGPAFGLNGDDEFTTARDAFLHLFYDINKRAKRGTNPWVWALTFKVVKP